MRALYAIDLEDITRDLGEGRLLLERLGAEVDLLYVEPSPAPMTARLDAEIRSRESGSQERLEALLTEWTPACRGAVHVAYDDRAADRITALAGSYDLVVVGTHGRRGVSRTWLGSVAEKVVRASPVPVLVVHGRGAAAGARRGFRILVAVDGWEVGVEVLASAAARWAARLHGTIDLVHAVVISAPPDPIGTSSAAGGLQLAALFEDAEQQVTRLGERLPAEVRGTARAVWGEPASAILAAAADYDLVVVGTHGRSGLPRLWLGSIAERTVRRSPAPVLVIPTRK